MSWLVLPELQDAASGRCCADLGLKTRNCLAHLAGWPLSPGLRETEVGYLPRCSLASMACGSQSALGLRRRLSGLQHSPPGYVDTGHLPVLEQRTHTSLVSLGCPHPSTGQAGSAKPRPRLLLPQRATLGTPQGCTKRGPARGLHRQGGPCSLWRGGRTSEGLQTGWLPGREVWPQL